MSQRLAGLCLFLFLGGLVPAATAQSRPERIRLAVSTATPHNTPLWIAKDRRIFDRHGLDVQMIFVSGGTLVAQMLAAGEIEVAAAAPASLLSLIAGGEKIAMFLGLSNTSPFTLVTQPHLKKPAELKGKRIGTARFGGSSHVSALIAFDHLGLDPKRDHIVILQTGLDPERVAALEQKALDGAMLQRLATKTMLAKGYTEMLNLSKAKIPYQNTVLAARRDYLAKEPKTVENFVRAVVEGYAYAFNKENRQSVKEIIARNLRLPNAEAAEDFYQEALEEMDRKPYPTAEGTRTVIRYVAERNPKVAAIRAEEAIDASWLKKLESEGFFEKVYGR